MVCLRSKNVAQSHNSGLMQTNNSYYESYGLSERVFGVAK